MKKKVLFSPQQREIEVDQGTSLLKAASKAGIKLEADCGGMGRCGKCKVVIPKGVTHITPREREYLTPLEIRKKVRLACQAFVRSKVSVSLFTTPAGEDRILENGIAPSVSFQPLIKKYYLNLTAGDLKRKQAIIKIIEDFLLQHEVKKPRIGFSCLKTLPLLLPGNTAGVTAILRNREVLGFESGDTTNCIYGLAVDIGTTTVVGYLFNLNSGRLMGVDSALNQQCRHGSDVVTRIEHALHTPEGLKQLQDEVNGTVNRIIENLCRLNDISHKDIYSLTVVGNTPMNHFFLGISPQFLSRSPYNPLTTERLCVSSYDLGININALGRVFSLPLISGFIGSDAVAVILSTGLHKSRVPRMAIDIGTNGEIALTDGKTIVVCSAAAGPAFEGAHIQCGMRGASGAIDRVEFNDNIQYHVIDEVPPKGICGSGLVDAVACILSAGLITNSGVLLGKEEIVDPVYARLVNKGKYNQFLLTGHETTPAGSQVVITQKDIRQLQLAKGAIMAGIKILMHKLGLKEDDIKEIYLAGGFGNYVRPESALAIKLLPNLKYAKVTQVGNAAGSGAKMVLLSTKALKEAVKIAEKVEYVDLAKDPNFNQEFTKGMAFSS